MKRNVFCILFLAFAFNLVANYPPVKNFSRKEYRSGAQNWSIAQDNNNIMYFANNNGLLIYDGKNWSTVPIINGTSVRSLLYDGKDKVYASTFNDFGYFQKQSDGTFNYQSLVSLARMVQKSSNELFNICKSENNIFFQGERTIYVYNGKTISKYPFKEKIDASGIAHKVFFIACRSGLYMLNGNMFVHIQGSEILVNKKVCSILPYQHNKILIVTSLNGVYIYDGLAVVPFSTGIDDFLRSNQVFCAATNGSKIVYGTVQRGVAIQDMSNKSVMFVNTFSGLQNNTILSAAFDNQNNLWLGLDKGIDYVELNSSALNIFGTNNLYGAGYTSLIRNNVLYLGTNQGLYFCKYPLINSPVPLQLNLLKGMEGQVWSLSEIDNTIFCGDDQGAFILNGSQTERIKGLPGTWSFKRLKRHPDLILGCSYQGLFILKKTGSKWAFSHFVKGNFNESSPMFEEDDDGTVWFSHWQKGLFRLYFNPSYDSVKHVTLYNETKGFPSNHNNTLFRINNQIVFSSERGFYMYNRHNDKMEPYEKFNHLFNTLPAYMRLHEGKNGDIWFMSGRFLGVARKDKNNSYRMDSLTYRTLQSKVIIGFENLNFIDNNNLIMNTEDGFSWIKTQPQQPTGKHFKVILLSVVTTNNDSNESPSRQIVDNLFANGKINHHQNSLRFEFIAPEYRNENMVEYSYMLENYDKSWSEYSHENTKEYNHLPRGNYVFRVRAKNLLEKDEAVMAYSFTVLPAWYETTFAFIVYIILIMAAIAGLFHYVRQQSEQGAKKMEIKKEIEIQEQKKIFDEETQAKKREIKELKNQQLQYELRHKSQELATSTMNLIRKNEILFEIIDNISKTSEDIRKNTESAVIQSRLSKMERSIKENIENDNNWKRFEENFDIVYENYLKRLGETYPELSVSDKKLCAYIKMDLSSKDMAPLLNMSVRSIETNRYRIRKKLGLERETNLAEFLQKF